MLTEIARRLLRVLTFKPDVFVEIRDDEQATLQAAIVVLVTSVLWAIGIGTRAGLLVGLLFGPLVLWLLWTSVAWLLGTRLLGGQGSWLGLARVLGYVTAPLAIGVLGLVPCGGLLAAPISWLLAAALSYLAMREALELSSERALLTALLSISVAPIAWTLLRHLL
ncbi:MAG: YIP1 family protein [Anaerolineae bacterium]|jgi:hypothetical protein